MDELYKESGRYRLNEEDKARPLPLKLHQHYIDRLTFMPGKNNAEKIRNLIDNSCDWFERERRQVREIRRLIYPLYDQARRLVDPELKKNNVEYLEKLNKFQTSLKTLETLLEVMHFDFGSLKKHLTDRDVVELEIVFAAKQSLL